MVIMALSSSCHAVLPEMNVPVLVPPLPSCWADAEGWALYWVSADVSGGPVMVAPDSVASLSLPRGKEAAVLCSAVFGNARSLPYGASWPQGLSDDGSLRLNAAGGFAASVAAPLYRAGYACCGIDLRRFAVEAEARLEDPWDICTATLTDIVAEGRFRVDYLSPSPVVHVTLSGIPCLLASDSPWGRMLEPDSMGTVVVRIRQDRVRRWFGQGYVLAILVSSSGACSWTLSGPMLKLGSFAPSP